MERRPEGFCETSGSGDSAEASETSGMSDASAASVVMPAGGARATTLPAAPIEADGREINAAAAYLAELHSDASRRAVRSRLSTAARLLGAADCMSLDWGRLRYVHVVAFVHELSDRRGLSAVSVNAYLSALKGVAQTAWRLRQMDMTSCAEIRAVKQLRVERQPAGRALEADESVRLMAAAEGDGGPRALRDRAILALLLGCGLRRAEVTTLRREDLEADGRTLRVIGKGNRERRVFLNDAAAPLVAAWCDVRGDAPGLLFGRFTKGGRLVLDRPLDPASIGRIVGRLQAEAGIDPITTHDLRRTFATRLLARNVDIVAVKNLMGHASVTTTAKYDRRTEEALRRAAMLAEL